MAKYIFLIKNTTRPPSSRKKSSCGICAHQCLDEHLDCTEELVENIHREICFKTRTCLKLDRISKEKPKFVQTTDDKVDDEITRLLSNNNVKLVVL